MNGRLVLASSHLVYSLYPWLVAKTSVLLSLSVMAHSYEIRGMRPCEPFSLFQLWSSFFALLGISALDEFDLLQFDFLV